MKLPMLFVKISEEMQKNEHIVRKMKENQQILVSGENINMFLNGAIFEIEGNSLYGDIEEKRDCYSLKEDRLFSDNTCSCKYD